MRFTRRSFIFLLLTLFLCAPVYALNVKGTAYISMRELSRICGMRISALQGGKIQSVYSHTSRLTFEENSRAMTLNNVSVWLGYPVVEYKGMLYIAKHDYLKTIRPILFPQQMGKIPNVFHIYLDAGHGGKDVGAQNKAFRINEKAVTLDVTLRLGKILRQNGYRVSFSRTTDKTVELSDRAENATRVKADLFLSIHCNAASSGVSGIETFAMTPRSMPSTAAKSADRTYHIGNSADGWDQLLSYYIQRDLISKTRASDRGVKRARFAVLRGTPMPSSLVEIGFLSNSQDVRKLASPAYRQSIAKSLANSIMRYHSTIRRLKNAK